MIMRIGMGIWIVLYSDALVLMSESESLLVSEEGLDEELLQVYDAKLEH